MRKAFVFNTIGFLAETKFCAKYKLTMLSLPFLPFASNNMVDKYGRLRCILYQRWAQQNLTFVPTRYKQEPN